MQFEKTDDSSHPYRLIFEGAEIETVKASFREEMFKHAKKGNVGSISDYDTTMADWSYDQELMTTRLISPDRFAERLEDFHEYTDEAIVDIALESSTPPFLNDDIILRRSLGAHALELANQIREEAAKYQQISEEAIEAVDMDVEFSGLLGDEDPSDSDDVDIID